jgi:hypothetical protein
MSQTPAPLNEDEIWDIVNKDTSDLTPFQLRIWETIKIIPGGFWAVAAFGSSVIWYNEIEEGFNLSNYKKYGVISEFFCDQLDLNIWLRRLESFFKGEFNDLCFGRLGPPEPLT